MLSFSSKPDTLVLERPAPTSTNPFNTFKSKPFTGTIHFELFSKDTFTVTDVTNLNSIFKSIQGFKYDHREKKWLFPLSEYHNLLPLIKEKEPKANLQLIPSSIINIFTKLMKEAQFSISKIEQASYQHYTSLKDITFDLSFIDDKLKQSLLPFQLAGLK